MSMLVGLEELTRASREEIVRRAPLIQKHLTDAIRVLGRPVERRPEYSVKRQNDLGPAPAPIVAPPIEQVVGEHLQLVAAGRRLSVPLTPEYIDVAITLLTALKGELKAGAVRHVSDTSIDPYDTADDDIPSRDLGRKPADVAELELGSVEQLDLSSEA
jgi:hypothetical protein